MWERSQASVFLIWKDPFPLEGAGCWKPARPLPRPSLRLQHLLLLHTEEKGMNSAVGSTAPHFLPHQGSPCGPRSGFPCSRCETQERGRRLALACLAPGGGAGPSQSRFPHLPLNFGARSREGMSTSRPLGATAQRRFQSPGSRGLLPSQLTHSCVPGPAGGCSSWLETLAWEATEPPPPPWGPLQLAGP